MAHDTLSAFILLLLVLDRLNELGVEIPFPQRVMHAPPAPAVPAVPATET